MGKKVLSAACVLGLMLLVAGNAHSDPVDSGNGEGAGWTVSVPGVGSVVLAPRATASIATCTGDPCVDQASADLVSVKYPVGSLTPTAAADALHSEASAYRDGGATATLQAVMAGASGVTLPNTWNTRGYGRATGFSALNGAILANMIEAETVSGTRTGGAGVVPATASGARVVNLRLAGTLSSQTLAPILPGQVNQILLNVGGVRIVFWETNWSPATATTTDGNPVWVNALHISDATSGIDIQVGQANARSVYTAPPEPEPTPTAEPEPSSSPTGSSEPEPDPSPTGSSDPEPEPTPTEPGADPTPIAEPGPDPTPTEPEPDPTPTEPEPEPTPTEPEPEPTPTEPEPDPTPTEPDPTPTPPAPLTVPDPEPGPSLEPPPSLDSVPTPDPVPTLVPTPVPDPTAPAGTEPIDEGTDNGSVGTKPGDDSVLVPDTVAGRDDEVGAGRDEGLIPTPRLGKGGDGRGRGPTGGGSGDGSPTLGAPTNPLLPFTGAGRIAFYLALGLNLLVVGALVLLANSKRDRMLAEMEVAETEVPAVVPPVVEEVAAPARSRKKSTVAKKVRYAKTIRRPIA